MKFGKRAPRRDPRTLKLSHYLKPAGLPPAPQEVSWVVKPPTWPMYLNDQLGDCVEAAMAHMVNQWTFYASGQETLLTDSDVLKAYEAIGGYVPGHPSTDKGSDMLTALNYWRKTGIGGHKILGYVAIDPANVNQVKLSIELFGNVFLGLALPLSVEGASDWTVPEGGIYLRAGLPGGLGGHCVPVMAASPLTRTCITWGGKLKMSANFLADYADEAYAVLSPDWIEKNGIAPSVFNLDALKADLAAL